MQGHQFDPLGVGFQPQGAAVGGIGSLSAALHLVGEPRHQPLATAAAFPRLLQQLAQVTQVGEHALALHGIEQVGSALNEDLIHHRQRPACGEQFVQAMESAGFGIPGRGIATQRLHPGQAATPQARHQRGAQRARIFGMNRRVQQQAQLARGAGIEHAGL